MLELVLVEFLQLPFGWIVSHALLRQTITKPIYLLQLRNFALSFYNIVLLFIGLTEGMLACQYKGNNASERKYVDLESEWDEKGLEGRR